MSRINVWKFSSRAFSLCFSLFHKFSKTQANLETITKLEILVFKLGTFVTSFLFSLSIQNLTRQIESNVRVVSPFFPLFLSVYLSHPRFSLFYDLLNNKSPFHRYHTVVSKRNEINFPFHSPSRAQRHVFLFSMDTLSNGFAISIDTAIKIRQ